MYDYPLASPATPSATPSATPLPRTVPIRDTGPRPSTHDSYLLELAKKADEADRAARAARVAHAAHAAHVAHTARAAAHATPAPHDFHIGSELKRERELRDLRMQRERDERELRDLRAQRERDEQRARGYHHGMIVSHGMPPFGMPPQVMFGHTPPPPYPGLHVRRVGW